MSSPTEYVHLAKHYNGAFVFLAYVLAVAGRGRRSSSC